MCGHHTLPPLSTHWHILRFSVVTLRPPGMFRTAKPEGGLTGLASTTWNCVHWCSIFIHFLPGRFFRCCSWHADFTLRRAVHVSFSARPMPARSTSAGSQLVSPSAVSTLSSGSIGCDLGLLLWISLCSTGCSSSATIHSSSVGVGKTTLFKIQKEEKKKKSCSLYWMILTTATILLGTELVERETQDKHVVFF